MATTTRIQFRRGYSTAYAGNPTTIGGRSTSLSSGFVWKTDSLLEEGEIGYEIDTGKFKIGKLNNIGDRTPWANLPYAGGSELISATGIGLVFNDQNNAYTIHSFITGVVGGQEGITFQTLPLSGLLNNPNASGTYYRIGLSTKLEDLHDSYFSFNNNLISSTGSVGGTGIVISGYNNSTIALNPNGGTVTSSGIDIRNITAPITVTEAVGGLSKGVNLTSSSGITEILRIMLEKVFEPTVGQVPSVSMNLSGSVSPAGSSSSFVAGGRYEVGTTGNITISSTLVQGYVAGTGLGAGWDPNGNQGVRAGIATAYSRTLGGNTNTDFATSNTISSYSVVLGSNTASATINHASGITPKNSIGNNSTTLPVLQAGTVSNTITLTGVRRMFYVYDTTGSAPSTSANVRALTSSGATFESGKSIWDYGPGTVFRIAAPVGTKRIIVAVPSGLYSLGNSITVLDETSLNADISSSYNNNLTTISVSGANGASAITYNIYSFIPDVPFANTSTHKITLN